VIDVLRRVARVVVLALLVVGSCHAFAATEKKTCWQVANGGGYPSLTTCYDSASAASAADSAWYGSQEKHGSVTGSTWSGLYVTATFSDGYSATWRYYSVTRDVEITCPAKNTLLSSGYYDIGTSSAGSPAIFACFSQCLGQFDGVSPAGSALVSGTKHWYAYGGYYSSGVACDTSGTTYSTSVTAVASIPSSTCSTADIEAESGGNFICVDSAGNTTATNNPDSTGTKGSESSTTTTTTNADGSTTATTTTTKTDASGNTQTVVTTKTCDSSGTSCTSTTKTEGDKLDSEKSYCELYPDTVACADVSSVPDSESITAFTRDIAINPVSGFDFDKSCPADMTVSTALAGNITIPWSYMCDLADRCRPVVIAVAYLLSILAFFGISKTSGD
jgi:hypothetical protein